MDPLFVAHPLPKDWPIARKPKYVVNARRIAVMTRIVSNDFPPLVKIANFQTYSPPIAIIPSTTPNMIILDVPLSNYITIYGY